LVDAVAKERAALGEDKALRLAARTVLRHLASTGNPAFRGVSNPRPETLLEWRKQAREAAGDGESAIAEGYEAMRIIAETNPSVSATGLLKAIEALGKKPHPFSPI
jgi:hypothetical protein